MKTIKIVLYFFLLPLLLHAQDGHNVQVVGVDKAPAFFKKHISLDYDVVDSITATDIVKRVITQLHNAGYLEASADSIALSSDSLKMWIHVGNPYRWATLRNGNIPPSILKAIHFPEKQFQNTTVSTERLRKVQEQLLTWAENNGYPFARTWLDEVHVQDSTVYATLRWNKGRFITIKDIKIESDVKISQHFLTHYLNIKIGSAYSERKIKNIRDHLQELSFVKESKPPVVHFQGEEAVIHLFLEKQKTNAFDFLLGIAPQQNDAQIIGEQRLLLTGTFSADLHNTFGAGERFTAHFEQLRPRTQELQLRFQYPYLLQTPFGTTAQFELYRRDSAWLDVISSIGLEYGIGADSRVQVFWKNTASSLLTIDEASIRASRQLPATLDVRNASFGIEYAIEKTDYRLNPRRGWTLYAKGAAGIKRIKESNLILNLQNTDDTFDYASLYDSLSLRSAIYQPEVQAEAYFPLFKRSVLKTAIRAAALLSQKNIYENELYRIGGSRLLRGFNEESILASSFLIFTLEYRFLIGTNSYFFLFNDLAYTENHSVRNRISDRPLGFGGGLSFETKAGIFGLSLAYGKQQNNPIDFAEPKVHFGYVGLF